MRQGESCREVDAGTQLIVTGQGGQAEINRRFAAQVLEHQLELARAERNLAVAALRLYRHALEAAEKALDVEETGFTTPFAVRDAIREQVKDALAGAAGILQGLEKGKSDGQVQSDR